MKRPVVLISERWLYSRALFVFLSAFRILLLAALGMVVTAASAGSFSVNPVRVELSAQRSSAVVQVENTGSTELTVEARTFVWAQPEGKDQLSTTREVIVTPQVFRMKAGATQLLRIGALRKPDQFNELPYRLVLEEIPPPPAPDLKGLQVALRISMPVFLRPPVEAKDKIDVVITAENDRQLRLIFSNTGNASAALSNLSISEEDSPDQLIATHSGVTYVLAGQRRELILDSKRFNPDKKILIRARSPAGPVTLHAVSSTP
jgi:fimbrial chaperone protein